MKKRLLILPLLGLLLTSCDFFTPKTPDGQGEKEDEGGDDTPDIPDTPDTPDTPDIPDTPDTPEEGKFKGYAPEGYSLTWEDEFEGDKLDSRYWEHQIGDGSDYGIYRYGNNEEQYYKAENTKVKDGKLTITAKKELTHTERYDFQYTSSRLRTKGKVSTTFGYIEARIKLPAGTGMWPAFWMLPEGSYNDKGWPVSGEIDIMEAKGRELGKYGATTHSANSADRDAYHNKDYVFSAEEGDITNFHCYAVEWLERSFVFSVDGKPFFTVSNTVYQNGNTLYSSDSPSAPFNQDFHILLNLAVGGNYDGNRKPDDSFVSADMVVDYVRIFEKN